MTVTTSKLAQVDEVRGGGSYLSSSDQRLHFGLGSDSVIKQVQIEWPSGLVEKISDVAADRVYTIVEGRGIQQTDKFNSSVVDAPTKNGKAAGN
jgi:hypothetical protein